MNNSGCFEQALKDPVVRPTAVLVVGDPATGMTINYDGKD